jgi:hypothetical protein
LNFFSTPVSGCKQALRAAAAGSAKYHRTVRGPAAEIYDSHPYALRVEERPRAAQTAAHMPTAQTKSNGSRAKPL